MLKSKEVKISWYYKTKNHYQDKCYIFSSFGDKFNVKVEDLYEGASVEIEIKCDYCGEVFNRRYCDHVAIIKKELLVTKDSCAQCRDLKKREILECKQNDSQLTRDMDGYWTFKENRLKELDDYIKKYNTLDSVSTNEEGNIIAQNFYKQGHQIIDGVIELGYDPRKVFSRMPEGYYDDFEKLKLLINEFINDYGKFPTVAEMKSEFKFDTRHISKHGGIDKIKEKMGYVDDSDLIDDNGYKNRSAYEYLTSQYLIHNGVKYKREQYPFPSSEGRFRSDFTLCPMEGREIHVEVWGMDSSEEYLKTKNKKLSLYKKYNVPLISINQNVFAKKTLDKTQGYLYDLFSPYLNIEYKKISKRYLITPNSLTNEELFDSLMELSTDGKTLPATSYLKEIKSYGLYNQVVKRFNNYAAFAKKFNVKNQHKKHYWSCDEIENQLNIVVKDNHKDISKKAFIELGLSGLLSTIEKSYGMMQTRLNYYMKDDFDFIHDKDLKILNNIVDNKGTNIKNKVTPEQQEQAKQILEKYNSKILNTSPLG